MYRRVVTVTVDTFDDSEAQLWLRKILCCNPSSLTKNSTYSIYNRSMYTYIDILQQLVWIRIRVCTLCIFYYMCKHLHVYVYIVEYEKNIYILEYIYKQYTYTYMKYTYIYKVTMNIHIEIFIQLHKYTVTVYIQLHMIA